MNLAAHHDPLIGQVIAGRYEVVRRIAKGGMGILYEVRNTKLGRTFALKTVTAEAAQDPEVLARFRREAEVVARLSHPNIVEVVDWDEHDGCPLLVMEFLRGETLKKRIEAVGGFRWRELGTIADQVLSALSVAHHAGVVHRDLKPQNIFLAADDAGQETVKLLDFGISKIRDSSTFATTDARLLGTPAYMAPEQAEGLTDQIGPATDLWAIGAILYEMVTGKVAFDAPSTPAILYRVCTGRPTPIRELRHDVPDELVALIDRTLDTDARLDDVDALRDELRAVLSPLAGVTWSEPMRSRTSPAIPRTLTPLPVRIATPPQMSRIPARALTPPAMGRLGPPPAELETAPTILAASPMPTLDEPRRSRRGLVVGTLVLVAIGAIAIVMFVVLAPGDDAPFLTPVVVERTSIDAAAEPIPVEAAKPAVVAPETVEVAITSNPEAEVYQMPRERKVGDTPWSDRLERGTGKAVYILKRPGYLDERVEFDLTTGGSKTFTLKHRVKSAPPVRKPPDGRRKGDPAQIPFGKKP